MKYFTCTLILLGALVGNLSFSAEVDSGNDALRSGLEKVGQALALVHRYEGSQHDVLKKVTEAAIRAIVTGYDRHSRYFTAEETRRFRTELFTGVRSGVFLPAVVAVRLPEGIGYVHVKNYTLSARSQLRLVISVFNLKKVNRGLIIDLRGNPGGPYETAVALANQFIRAKEKLLLRVKGVEGGKLQRMDYFADGEDIFKGGPIVVLVDRGSGSSSEILAGILQYHKRAFLVGERTYGKCTIQSPYSFSNGAVVYVTTGKWMLPDEAVVCDTGLKPDVYVQNGADSGTAFAQSGVDFLYSELSSGSPRYVALLKEDRQLFTAVRMLIDGNKAPVHLSGTEVVLK